MGKIAFVFAGQGAQYPGMGKEAWDASQAARRVFEVADGVRPGTSAQCFEGTKEELSITINTQPCLFAADLAIARALEEKGIRPEAVAGFSLGEIPALTFGGVFSTEEGFRIVKARGEAMNRAAEKHQGAMAAVLKLTPEKVEELCGQVENVWPVNYNSPAQTVVAAEKSALDGFVKLVKEAKGMAMPLAVSGAFHSPQMAEASAELTELLANTPVNPPEIPVYANADAAPYPAAAEEIKARIGAQVKSPVQWQKTVERMIADGFDTFVEVGPGKTLSGLIKKIAPEAIVYNVDNGADLQAVCEALL